MVQEAAWMPGFDPATGMLTLPLWVAVVALALLLILVVRLVMRAGFAPAGPGWPQYALVGIGLLLAWLFLDRSVTQERADARRALEARVTALTAQSVAPGSALACLDAAPADTAEAACERVVFASAEQVASAVSYVGAQWSLIADAAAAKSTQASGALADLQQSLESDRFGVVAHVLSSRYGCTAEKCEALELLASKEKILANLKDDTFGQSVTRYAAVWNGGGQPVAAAAPVGSPAEKSTTASNAVPGSWSFPSAASIPPVSIMNAEPAGPPPSASANAEPAPPPAAAAPPTPTRRPASAQRRNAAAPQPGPSGVQSAPLPAPTPPAPRANAGVTPPAPQASTAGAPLNTTPLAQ